MALSNKSRARRTSRNSIPLTTDTLRAAYDYLTTTPPFNRWNLPDADDIGFKVAKDPHLSGWHDVKKKRQIIAISSACVGHTSNLIGTMAHEMLHLHQELTGQATPGVGHNAAFHHDAEIICAIHGFDHKAF